MYIGILTCQKLNKSYKDHNREKRYHYHLCLVVIPKICPLVYLERRVVRLIHILAAKSDTSRRIRFVLVYIVFIIVIIHFSAVPHRFVFQDYSKLI
ncbi:MAG: hypothetical protein E7672_02365 [Ruminococcaceae bacterium]|nr:hypothetical protein [Oscillospiraceae bacterium]